MAEKGVSVDTILGHQELLDRDLHIQEILDLFSQLGLEMSFWEGLCIVDKIKRTLDLSHEEQKSQHAIS